MYYVKTKDVAGHEAIVEVSYEVYQAFEDERKELERERYERRQHWDKRGLEDYILANESIAVSEKLEDLFFRLNTLRTIQDVVRACTHVQQKRFYLHCVCGYSYAEIARMYNCSVMTVKGSVASVLKKIKKVM
jgi:DNA-directed RNA polymerase specialized sigma24 family protein